MIRIKLLFLLLFSTVGFVGAQTLEERDKIISRYDKAQIASLVAELQLAQEERNTRIEDYLRLNPEAKESIYDDGKTYQIKDIVDGKPLYIASDNAISGRAIRTNTLYPGGSLGLSLEGEGMTIGIWEAADDNGGHYPLKNHVEFMDGGVSRVTTPDTGNPNPVVSFHSTHVVGTVGAKGVNSNAKGMAPKSDLLAYSATGDDIEVVTAHVNTAMLISNHSYGVPIFSQGNQVAPTWYMGCYSSDARAWDQIAFTNSYYLMVTSGGNSGQVAYTGGFAAGFDKLTGNANSKNNLVVANADVSLHPITGVINSVAINSSSSQGPTDDGRIKPDITGDGTQVLSASDQSTTSYANATGTSMASPSVAGTLLLLQEYYNSLHGDFMLSSTARGLVCHTALDDNLRPGPDPYFGWGLMDARFAAQTITKAFDDEAIITEQVLSIGAEHTYTVNVSGLETLKATICWTDPAGSARDGQVNSTTPVLVNDLDLRVFDSEGNEFFPWKLQVPNASDLAIKGDNIVDNIERVDVEAPSGSYTIVVSHKGFLLGLSQTYSLIVTGSDLNLNTPDLEYDNVKIWPNPAKDKLNINFGNLVNDAIVKLYDIQGRIVYNQVFKNVYNSSANINVESLANGVYTLTINSGNQVLNKKIVIN